MKKILTVLSITLYSYSLTACGLAYESSIAIAEAREAQKSREESKPREEQQSREERKTKEVCYDKDGAPVKKGTKGASCKTIRVHKKYDGVAIPPAKK